MPAYSVIFSFRDAKGKSSTTEVNIPTGLTLANMTIFAQEMAKLIDPLITGVITRIGLAINIALPAGLAANPLSTSDVEEGGKFQFSTAGGYYTGLRIPTWMESLVSAGSDDINTLDADVAAFVAAMMSGIDLTTATPVAGTGTVTPTDGRGDDITALVNAKEQFVNSR